MFGTHVSNAIRYLPFARTMKILGVIFSTLALLPLWTEAQDIRGGEITYHWISGTTYSFDIVMYTQTSIGDSHDTVIFDFGDGELDTLNGSPISIFDLTEWNYSATHTFPGPGIYITTLTDSFRIASIQNLDASSSKSISINNTMLIDATDTNSSPVLLTKQPSIFSDGNYFYHSINAYDPNGDSISFALNAPAGDLTYLVPIGATIDPITGDFQMPFSNSPHLVIIEILEWQDGLIIGRINREMIFDSTATTSIKTLSPDRNMLQIYPNPAQNRLTIEAEVNIDRVVIYSLLGKEILAFQNINKNLIVIDIDSLSSGVYLVIAYGSDDQSYMNKLVTK